MKTSSPRLSRNFLPPLSFLRMLWKRKLLTGIIWVTGAAISAGIVWTLPSIYRAETSILVEQQKIPEKLVTSTVQVELQDRLATIQQQILSSTRLMEIINKRNLYAVERKTSSQEEITERMRSDISIVVDRQWTRNRPGAFRVSYKGADPQVVASVANELGSLFIEENLKAREVQAEGTSEFLTTQVDEARKRLQDQENKLADFKRRHAGQLPGQENSIMVSMTQVQAKLQNTTDAIFRAQQTRELLESELRSVESSLQRAAAVQEQRAAAPPPPTPAEAAVAAAAAPPKRSEALQRQLEEVQRRYTEQHPMVKAMRAELERVRQEEARAAASHVPAPSAPAPRPAVQTRPPETPPQVALFTEQQQERLQRLKAQLSVLQEEENQKEREKGDLNIQLANMQARVNGLPVREQEMLTVTRDYEISKKNYEELLGKTFTADMATEMERRQKAERFAILDVARVPERPFQPNRPLLAGAGAAVALLLGLILGFALEFRKDVILGEWELPPTVPLLGRVPEIHVTPDKEDPKMLPQAQSATENRPLLTAD